MIVLDSKQLELLVLPEVGERSDRFVTRRPAGGYSCRLKSPTRQSRHVRAGSITIPAAWTIASRTSLQGRTHSSHGPGSGCRILVNGPMKPGGFLQ